MFVFMIGLMSLNDYVLRKVMGQLGMIAICGPPGVGKTTICKSILKNFSSQKMLMNEVSLHLQQEIGEKFGFLTVQDDNDSSRKELLTAVRKFDAASYGTKSGGGLRGSIGPQAFTTNNHEELKHEKVIITVLLKKSDHKL